MGFGGWLKDMAFDSAATAGVSVLGPFAPLVGPKLSDDIQAHPFHNAGMMNPLTAPLSLPAAASNLIQHGSIDAPEKKEPTGLGNLNPQQFGKPEQLSYDPAQHVDTSGY